MQSQSNSSSRPIPVEITINSMVKAVVKTACHPILYNGPLQRHNGGLRYTIVFSSTILLTRVLYPPINTVYPLRNKYLIIASFRLNYGGFIFTLAEAYKLTIILVYS